MFGDSTVAIQKLQKNSDKIVSVFTKTITDLSNVNQEVDDHLTSRDEEIKRIQEEKARLASIKENNQKMIDKLNKLFE
jgi:hypothetical protein